MLVLSRRREETIVIGGEIEVVVLHVGHDAVKLGVRAPKSVPVYRGELYEQVASENRAALTAAAPADDVLAALRGSGIPPPEGSASSDDSRGGTRAVEVFPHGKEEKTSNEKAKASGD